MNEKEIKVLIFSINDQYYAADIMEIERILGYEEPTQLPDAPEFVKGVINYQGNIIPIMNLAKKFKISQGNVNNDAKIVVAKQEKNRIGIIVDVVSEVSDVKTENIEEAPEIIAGISKRYIKGLIKISGKIIIFLNVSTILTQEEKKLLLK
ncbi:chemotaxis protein CheW [Clostridium aestuarii]|uniref:Chemotaxis protein CheW n=1 Tax=Clostridium aestuarii TaxID=338193 RepID=A0ABT4CXC7_9CLOT|nr:chemotaxis protein CheW [Clostridium aestuarii]MCY6483644.1 chemotaxis protein CheW [Clostridium aestuarii]